MNTDLSAFQKYLSVLLTISFFIDGECTVNVPEALEVHNDIKREIAL